MCQRKGSESIASALAFVATPRGHGTSFCKGTPPYSSAKAIVEQAGKHNAVIRQARNLVLESHLTFCERLRSVHVTLTCYPVPTDRQRAWVEAGIPA